MKNILAIILLSLLITSCSTNITTLESNTENTIVDNIQCSKSFIKELDLPVTNGKEIPSNRKYCYVWELQKQDRTVVLTKTGVSKHTKYISWSKNTAVVINSENHKNDKSIFGRDLYKFTNQKNFSINSEKIKVRSSFYLEQNGDDIYLSLISNYVFKDTNLPKNPEIDLANRVMLKIGETVIIQVPKPYINDNNKFYNLKFTIHAFD